MVFQGFCGVLVTDRFSCGEVSRYGFQCKASETASAEISVGESDVARAAVLAGMLGGSSSKQRGACGRPEGCALGLRACRLLAALFAAQTKAARESKKGTVV